MKKFSDKDIEATIDSLKEMTGAEGVIIILQDGEKSCLRQKDSNPLSGAMHLLDFFARGKHLKKQEVIGLMTAVSNMIVEKMKGD